MRSEESLTLEAVTTALRILCGAAFFMTLLVTKVQAAPASLTYMHDHLLFTVNVNAHGEWRSGETQWLYRGMPAVPTFCGTETDCDPNIVPEGWTTGTSTGWNREAMKATIQKDVIAHLERDAGSVIISQSGSGIVTFSGAGLTGRKIDADLLVRMTITALEEDVAVIRVPVEEVQPQMTIDPALTAMGIKEVVTVGESNFAGSPVNRKHNIAVGLSKFNGTVIPQGAVFSFNEILGPVNAATGYRKELVIMGMHTLPDFGGGLCQVSSTAYRGVWEYGFPIDVRRNHSYVVQYYAPYGTDATIYPPHTDMKFTNDSPGALLIQTFTDENDHAYFVYYGTKDTRKSDVFGPYIWGTTPAPEEVRTEYTTDIPAGTQRKVGSKVPGVKVSWFRYVKGTDASEEVTETSSSYEARPLFYQIGIAPGSASGSVTPAGDTPTWLPSIE